MVPATAGCPPVQRPDTNGVYLDIATFCHSETGEPRGFPGGFTSQTVVDCGSQRYAV
jgi:hypothetical protein